MTSSGVGSEILLIRLSEYAEVGALALRLERLLDAGILNIVFDLEAVALVSSTLLGAFVKAKDGVAGRGGNLVLAGPSAFIQKTVRVLGLTDTLPCFSSVDEAIRHFRPR